MINNVLKVNDTVRTQKNDFQSYFVKRLASLLKSPIKRFENCTVWVPIGDLKGDAKPDVLVTSENNTSYGNLSTSTTSIILEAGQFIGLGSGLTPFITEIGPVVSP
jgi:hypothetical protein